MKKTLLILAIAIAALAACSKQEPVSREMPVRGNAAYYWRTTLRLDSTERAFIADHDIRRLYTRYFDVVIGAGDTPQPNATITFDADLHLPDSLEIVPTVFITENCLRASEADSMPQRIVRRILQMNETNDIAAVSELPPTWPSAATAWSPGCAASGSRNGCSSPAPPR